MDSSMRGSNISVNDTEYVAVKLMEMDTQGIAKVKQYFGLIFRISVG